MKKTILKYGATITLAILICFGFAISADASSGWKQDDAGWWYSDDDGSYPKSSWKKINDNWYYFKADGYMAANGYYPLYWTNGKEEITF